MSGLTPRQATRVKHWPVGPALTTSTLHSEGMFFMHPTMRVVVRRQRLKNYLDLRILGYVFFGESG